MDTSRKKGISIYVMVSLHNSLWGKKKQQRFIFHKNYQADEICNLCLSQIWVYNEHFYLEYRK